MVDVTVAVPAGPLTWLVSNMCPPIIEFGSPVQRSKNEQESMWHVPIKLRRRIWGKIGPATLSLCRVFLDQYDGDKKTRSIRLCLGDTITFEMPKEETLLTRRVVLVPVAFRSEAGDDLDAYFLDMRYFQYGIKSWPIPSGHQKHKFKLRVQSQELKDRHSSHFYMVRCPDGKSNGHFTVEIEYEGEGSQ